MNGLPPIISTVSKVRTCDEHRSIILRKERLWQRFRKGQLRIYAETKAKNPPDRDYRGRMRVCYQNIFLLDDSRPSGHPEHIILLGHCFRDADGSIVSSGLIDPKEILVHGKLHVRLSKKEPACELCENGDMIPVEERFRGSKDYRPNTTAMSWLGLAISKTKRWVNRKYDLFDQRKAARATKP